MPRPTRDTFYKDENYGILKYLGEKNGKYIFESFVKSPFTHGKNSGWQKAIGTLELDSALYRRWMGMGRAREIRAI